GDMPAQVGAAAEAVVDGVIETGGVEVGSVRGAAENAGPARLPVAVGRRGAGTKVRGRREILAVEAAHITAELALVESVVARARGNDQFLRNDVEVHRSEGRLLNDGALRIVEESNVVVALVRVVRIRSRPGLDVVEAVVVVRRRAAGNGLVGPVGVVVNLELFIIDTADAAEPPIVRRAQPKFMALVSVLLAFLPGGGRREALAGRGRRFRIARAL